MTILEQYSILVSKTPDEILGRSRKHDIKYVRYFYWWTLRRIGYSYPRIARMCNRSSHATVLQGIKRINSDLDIGYKDIIDLKDKTEYLTQKSVQP